MEDNKIVIYQTPDGQTELEVRLQEETVWLNAEQMATLFDRDTKTIRKHINNAIKEELADVVVVAKFATTTQHGAIAGKEQTHRRQYLGRAHADDCREPHRRKRYDDQGSG